MKPNYIAKKSIVSVLSLWLILFSWLIIPAIIQIYRIIATICYSIEFYDNKIVVKDGIIVKNERQSVFAGVYAVSIQQSIMGRIFGYATLQVDCPGRWDLDTTGIKNARDLKEYLESRITTQGMTNIIHN